MEVRINCICDAVHDLDNELGRPPFPCTSTVAVRGKAAHLVQLLRDAREENRLSSLQSCEEVTTTLPILCAALPNGSGGQQPCLVLYRLLLDALSIVAPLSVYPLATILRDAQTFLQTDDAVLFQLTVAAGALTEERMRVFLRLTPVLPDPSDARASQPGKSRKSKAKSPTLDVSLTKATRSAEPLAVPLLRAILASNLSSEHQNLFLSLFTDTSDFIRLVRSETDLAVSILSIYGERMTHILKPPALLPVLDAPLLDYFVDMLQRQSMGINILTDKQHLEVSVATWEWDRVDRLCEASVKRRISKDDSYGSLLASAFLFTVVMTKERKFTMAIQENEIQQERIVPLWISALEAAQLLYEQEADNRHADHADVTNSHEVGEIEERWLQPLSIMAALWISEWRIGNTTRHWSMQLGIRLTSAVKSFLEKVILRSLASCMKLDSSPEPNPGQKSERRSGRKKPHKVKVSPILVSHTKPRQASRIKPLPYSSFLLMHSTVAFAIQTITPDGISSTECIESLTRSFAFYCSLLSKKLPDDVWVAYLDYVALIGWTAGDVCGDSRRQAEMERVLLVGTRSTSMMLWCTPFVAVTSYSHYREWLRSWGSDLIIAIWAAAILEQGKNQLESVPSVVRSASSHGNRLGDLYSLSPLLVFGLLASLMTDEQLGKTSDLVAQDEDAARRLLHTTEVGKGELHMCQADIHDLQSMMRDVTVSVDIAVGGLECLCARVKAELLARVAHMNHEREVTEMHYRQVAHERGREYLRLAEEKEAFVRDKASRDAMKETEQTAIREERIRREQERNARHVEEQRRKKEKQQHEMGLLHEHQRTLAEERNEACRVLFMHSKVRFSSWARVSPVLERLGLTPSRIMELQELLHPIIASMSLDDLFEYLVTGNTRVPDDMVAPGVQCAVAEDEQRPEAECAVRLPTNSFWADVLRDTPIVRSCSGGIEGESVFANSNACTATVPLVEQDTTPSFHRRAKLILDFFSFEGGDAFGTAPDPLPSVLIMSVSRVLALDEVRRTSGYDGALDAFMALQQRHLVTINEGIAQLTLLGYWYHFPFHDPRGSLHARTLANHERIQSHVCRLQKVSQSLMEDSDDTAVEEREEDTGNSDKDIIVFLDGDFSI